MCCSSLSNKELVRLPASSGSGRKECCLFPIAGEAELPVELQFPVLSRHNRVQAICNRFVSLTAPVICSTEETPWLVSLKSNVQENIAKDSYNYSNFKKQLLAESNKKDLTVGH